MDRERLHLARSGRISIRGPQRRRLAKEQLFSCQSRLDRWRQTAGDCVRPNQHRHPAPAAILQLRTFVRGAPHPPAARPGWSCAKVATRRAATGPPAGIFIPGRVAPCATALALCPRLRETPGSGATHRKIRFRPRSALLTSRRAPTAAAPAPDGSSCPPPWG